MVDSLDVVAMPEAAPLGLEVVPVLVLRLYLVFFKPYLEWHIVSTSSGIQHKKLFEPPNISVFSSPDCAVYLFHL